jgi:molybdopterin-guanine dinucleotide biosynthesis protein A
MGQDKATLKHPRGVTFLQHAIERLQQVCERVVVSGSCNAHHDLQVIVDSESGLGPSIGIVASLEYAVQQEFAAILVTPVDVPLLDSASLLSLIENWCIAGELTVAHSDQIEPLIAIYPGRLLKSFRQLAGSDDRSLIRYVEQQPHQIVAIDARQATNVNSPDDFAAVFRADAR